MASVLASENPRLRPKRELYPALKPWDLPRGILYGPFPTRRKGMSLGVNLLPGGDKVCTFNCVYCQCGWTGGPPPDAATLRTQCPDLAALRATFDTEFPRLATTRRPDALVLSGNGEPTLYPDFPAAMDLLLASRDRHFAGVPVTLLTAGTELGRPEIRAAAARCENPTVKLDAGDDTGSRAVDIPLVPYSVEALLGWLAQMPPVVLQACFVRGTVDNTTPPALASWLAAVRRARPRRVEIYSLDRVPPARGLVAVPRGELEAWAARVRDEAGVPADAF